MVEMDHMKNLSFMLTLLAMILYGCKDAPVETAVAIPSGPRVSRLTTSYLRILNQDPLLDTVVVDGTVYSIASKDSMAFQYDSQDRLINFDRTQFSGGSGGSYTNGPLKNVYAYSNGQFQEVEGGTGSRFSYKLDNTQRRVLSRTKKRNLYTELDTLRQYSPEGILTSVQTANYRQVFTIENGNVTRIEQYSNRTNKLDQTTELTYDLAHAAPPAQFTFLGETSRNALVSKKVQDYTAPGGAVTYTYSYRNLYDAQGRMIRQIEYHQDSAINQGKPYFWTATDYYY